MSRNQIKNISASVHERLLKKARLGQRPFEELLQYFAMERFLYRWSQSSHVKEFVLKGAVMLRVWEVSEFRPTRDIDMLANNAHKNPESIMAVVEDVISVEEERDGLLFLAETITGERIIEDADYEGVRVKFIAKLGNAKINLQIDIAFGDIVYPQPIRTRLPSMLGFPNAHLLCYSRESAIAEKFQAMTYLGDSNSRMKDFYDIYALSRQFDFEGKELAEAIRLTFRNRKTEVPKDTTLFTKEFIELKEVQWAAFRRKIVHYHLPESFAQIISEIEKFVLPVTQAIITGSGIPKKWPPAGPWNN
jgi:hypothetical protein